MIEVKTFFLFLFKIDLNRLYLKPVYGFNTSESVPFRSASGGGRCVYYNEDQTVNLDDVINNNNQNVKIPNDLSLRGK